MKTKDAINSFDEESFDLEYTFQKNDQSYTLILTVDIDVPDKFLKEQQELFDDYLVEKYNLSLNQLRNLNIEKIVLDYSHYGFSCDNFITTKYNELHDLYEEYAEQVFEDNYEEAE